MVATTPHVYEGLLVGNHFAGSNKECSKLSLGSQGHDKLDDGCICYDRAIEAWSWTVFGEVDMCTCSAVGSRFLEVSCICMRAEYHVTCSVDNAIIGVCGDVVQEHFNKLFHVYHCLSLSCADSIECYQQLIIDSLCIIN